MSDPDISTIVGDLSFSPESSRWGDHVTKLECPEASIHIIFFYGIVKIGVRSGREAGRHIVKVPHCVI